MIAYAEEASERVEEETRIAKAAEAEAKALNPEVAATPPKTAAEQLFGEEKQAAPAAAKPTLETLFGPDKEEPEKETLSAAQVLGDSPTPASADGASTQDAAEKG
jgi:hypothetical protein